MLTGEVLRHEYFEYSGTWMLAKGDDTLKQGETQQLAFDQQLQQMMQQQFGLQSAQLQYLNSVLRPMVENPQGLAPKDLTALRTSASDTISSQAANAKQAVQATEAAHGGGTGLESGPESQIQGQIATATAQQQSSAQNSITQYNEQVRQSNFWNAISGLSGNAALLNPTSYAGAANQGSGALANLGTAYYNTQQSGWLNAALGGLGAAAGGWASGGFALPGSKGSKGCWIAEAIFGETDDRTLAIRAWLNDEFALSWPGSWVMRLYIAHGKRVAALVRVNSLVRRALTPLFTAALCRADLWLGVTNP